MCNQITITTKVVEFESVSDPRIIRCGLDGSNRQTIVSSENTEIDEANGLSIGKVSRKYFNDIRNYSYFYFYFLFFLFFFYF
jgi:hypothetical protein